MKRTDLTEAIADDRAGKRLPWSTFIVVMIWSIPAYGLVLHQSGGKTRDVDIFNGPELPFYGGIVVAGWLMITLWLTSGKIDRPFGASTGSDRITDPILAERDRWLTPNRLFCTALIATVVTMIFIIHRFASVLSYTVAGMILWVTLVTIAPVLHRQLTGRPIRYRPDLANMATEPTSSLGVRGLMVLTFCIAAAIGAARRMSGGDLTPLYPPAAMGILGGLVWISMVFSSIGRKRRYLPVAIGLTVIEVVAAGQWILFSPAVDTLPVESVILFIASARAVGWVYLSVLRASGYRM